MITAVNESDAYTNAYEEDGHFFFEDEQDKVETTELIDIDTLLYDDHAGYILSDGRNLTDLII